MKLSLSNIMRLSQPFAVALAALLVVPSAHAASGTWTTITGTSLWSDAGNWSGGTIADGSGFTADFTTGITANTTVTLDSSRSIGHIIKDDTNGAINQFTIGVSGGSILTMATGGGGAPTITNSDAGPGGRLEIAAQLTGTEGLTKLGVGVVNLNNNNSNWSGNTTVSEGLLNMGAININNIGGGSGRNISVAAGAAISFNGLSNAHLNRIVETSAEFTVMTNGGGNNLDFTSATGANLSGAFLGNYSNVGGKAEVTGIITMADNYRLGGVNGLQNGTLGIGQASLLSGTNGLIVGANRVVIVGTHTFSGDTVLRDGARLGLSGLNTDAVGVRNNSAALQNSVLDLGAPTSTGQIFLEGGVAGGIVGFTTAANGATTSATFGGLKGSRDLNAAFIFTDGGNNVSSTVATAYTGFTLNVGTGVNVGYSGDIGGFGADATGSTGGAMTLTKTGEGTQALSGDATYTGATNVNEGTLIINGNFSTSTQTTVASSATIGGSGTVGNLTIQGGGTVAPGNSPGILTVDGDYVQAGAYEAEIQGLVAGNNPGNHDQIQVNGTVDITGGSLVTLFSSTGYSPNDMIFILLNDDVDAITGTYTGLAQGDFVTSYDGLDWVITYQADSVGGTFLGGNDIALVALVPEPSTALLGALGALALLRRRR